MDRRRVLAGTGIAFSAALAGCSDLDGDQADENDDGADDLDEDDHDQGNSTDDSSEDDTVDDQGDQDQDGEQLDEDEEYEIQEEEEQEEQGQDEDEQEDTEDDEEAEPEKQPNVILPEDAEEHLDVLNHELDSDGTRCEFYGDLERTSSDDEYHVSFDTEVTLYSDGGETVAEKSGPSVDRDDLREGESRVYSISFDDCEGANQYTFEVVNFSAILTADAMEADVEIHPELEDKLEVGHSFSWVDEPGSGRCRIRMSVENTTHDHVISATANSDDLDLGFTNIEPGESAEKEIEGSCSEDIEQYLVRIGTSDYEIEDAELVNDHNEEIDAEGEVSLSEEAEEHLEVQDHALIRNGSDGCEVRIEVEKTSVDKYLISFRAAVGVYSDDGEEIARRGGLGGPGTSNERIEKGESRIYSSLGLENCEGAAEYEIDVWRFGASVPIDELDPDFDLDTELEGKLKVTDSSIRYLDSVPLYDSEPCRKHATVKNVTEDYRLSVRGPEGDERRKTITLEPDETGEFYYSGWCSVSMDDLTYGYSIQAEEVTEIDS
ncbi:MULTISPECIES: hypothetical protein [Natrialbaceae]|uniref:hypothetical protein n=1 Tax=Natrialbaceae TaxID=1644061 RepID=UPI00207D0057|nr:hypothetical protein [Natronococcus sp. CG52]